MPVELKIILNENGDVNVTGPLQNRILCYGLLQTAQEVISRQAQQGEQPLVTPVSMVPPPNFKP